MPDLCTRQEPLTDHYFLLGSIEAGGELFYYSRKQMALAASIRNHSTLRK